MKRIQSVVLLFTISMTLLSCSSPEKKALKMAEEAIISNLYNPKSYQRTNYYFDSIFTSDGSVDALIGLYEVTDLIEEIKPLMNDLEFNSHMASYSQRVSIYDKHEYDSYKKKVEINTKKIQKLKDKIDSRMKAGLKHYNDTVNRKLAGYQVELSYKASSLSGKDLPGFIICIANPSSDKLLFTKSFDILEILKIQQGEDLISKTAAYLEDTDLESYNIDDFIDYIIN